MNETYSEVFNPITQAMKDLEYTRIAVARLLNVPVTAVEYTEKGMYSRPPDRILRHLGITLTQYHRFQFFKRQAWSGPKELPLEFPQLSELCHPHVEWRESICDLNLNQYADTFCVPRKTIRCVEEGAVSSLPVSIKQALFVACGNTLTEKLNKFCIEWYTENC